LFWVRKIFFEKAHERLFWALFAVPSIPVKKRFREKVWKFVNSREKVWINVNSREFAWKNVNLAALQKKLITKNNWVFLIANTVLPNSRFFTWIRVNSQIFTPFSRNIFFYRYGRQTKLKIASHGLFQKKSFVLKTIHVNSSYRKNKRLFVKKPMRGYFCRPYR
jgi:hypothetical protein